MDKTCVNCGRSEHLPGADYCDECGTKIADKRCYHPNCPDEGKTVLRQDSGYCPFCGEELYDPED